jgi:hypothetical protein
MHPTVRSWLTMSRDELDALYERTQAGRAPNGTMQGTAIVTGTPFTKGIAAFARLFGWQGKVFDMFASPDSGLLINRISPFSLSFIVAKVYRGPSWMDGKETIIIDYSTTSFFAKKVRDEIREVEPGVYLGKVWWGKTRLIDFALAAKS